MISLKRVFSRDDKKQELWVREMPKHEYVINLENNPIRT